jgi:hypothetical protein
MMQGQWKGVTAGGCINELTFRNNVFYTLTITRRRRTSTTICILLQQKKQAIDLIPGQILPYPCHIGFYVYTKGALPLSFALLSFRRRFRSFSPLSLLSFCHQALTPWRWLQI